MLGLPTPALTCAHCGGGGVRISGWVGFQPPPFPLRVGHCGGHWVSAKGAGQGILPVVRHFAYGSWVGGWVGGCPIPPPPPLGVGHLWVCGFCQKSGGWVPEITPPTHTWLRNTVHWNKFGAAGADAGRGMGTAPAPPKALAQAQASLICPSHQRALSTPQRTPSLFRHPVIRHCPPQTLSPHPAHPSTGRALTAACRLKVERSLVRCPVLSPHRRSKRKLQGESLQFTLPCGTSPHASEEAPEGEGVGVRATKPPWRPTDPPPLHGPLSAPTPSRKPRPTPLSPRPRA